MPFRTERLRICRGYTLIELLIVMGIMGLLGSMAVSLASITAQREKERELKRALWEIRDALDAYRKTKELAGASNVSASLYPSSLSELTNPATGNAAGGPPNPIRPRFLRRIPRDPFADPTLPPAQTWALRSYASESDNPKPGADVYDVHSMSERVGLNGIALKDW